MTTQLTPTDGVVLAEGAPPPATRRSPWPWVALALGIVALGFVAWHARPGAVADRIRNPAVEGAPRPVEPLFGFDHWLTLHQLGTIFITLLLAAVIIVGWRRHPGHPALLMIIVTTVLIWQDPIMNWAPFAVYNPQLWHWPETWALVSLSPSVEPFIVIGYATFYMFPFFPAAYLLRRIQARRPVDSFVWKHPLLSLTALIIPIGFVFDAFLEIFLVRTQLYIYSHVPAWGSFAAGEWYQFPLTWESLLVSTVMVPAGVLLHRDDTGKTQAEKLAQRVRAFRGRPVLGTFLVMTVIINVGYFAYGAGWVALKVTKTNDVVACPFPFPEAKVWDPQGFYEEAGHPGPFYPGIWSTWMSGQPDGRPDVTPPADGGRCSDAGA